MGNLTKYHHKYQIPKAISGVREERREAGVIRLALIETSFDANYVSKIF